MRVYNTLSGQKEEFVPGGKTVKLYVCGVTPYDRCHLGHAMSYIVFDVIRRYLEFKGHEVKHVQNFTDIDDKIIARANQKGVSTRELANKFIEEYFTSMDALNIKRADVYPRVTEEISKIIEIVSALIEKGHAYPTAEGVYFRVNSVPDYGKLSHRKLDDLAPGARIEPCAEKEHPLDFALWKASKPGEPAWESPWGSGRPGWHIECSAMSLKYQGETLDIHGGGQDLIFPHHENELAQTESFTGVRPFVRYWLHNGLVQVGEEKMSKSLGNLIPLSDALKRFGGDAIRLFVLSSHYRSPLTYSETGLEASLAGVERLRQALKPGVLDGEGKNAIAGPYRQRFIQAMDDDFNTAQAVSALFDLAREINRAGEDQKPVKAQETLRELAQVLGLTLEERALSAEAGPFVELLISLRRELRRQKQWSLADTVRDSLSKLGVVLEDSAEETKWRYAPKATIQDESAHPQG
ncbi:MAG: cysS [Dehalococcoidia bacterium]|nr:cysS [Dehalococcoidia bacterium]